MRRKLVDQRYNLPYFFVNPLRRISEPQANEEEVNTASEIITNYLQTDHGCYVRPLHILVCGTNPRAVKAVVEEITCRQEEPIYRADASCVDDDLGEVLQHNKMIVLDLMDNAFGTECPYMLGKRGALIWMMPPGEEADKLEADYRIDIKDLSVGEKRKCLKVATDLPFFVIDQLLDSDKDVWQIEEMLQLIKAGPYEPKDLDFIGRLFRVSLSAYDWLEDHEDEEFDDEDDLGDEDDLEGEMKDRVDQNGKETSEVKPE